MSTWEVVSQQPKSGPNAHGVYVPGVEVMIRTGKGYTGSAFFPMTDYAPEKVKGPLAALAAKLDGVGALTHNS